MRFCKMHLPKNDTTVFLENESGEEYILNYIAERTALSGGWKAFCAANNLHEGDVLVFHLLKPSRFKVHLFLLSNVPLFLVTNCFRCPFRNEYLGKSIRQ